MIKWFKRLFRPKAEKVAEKIEQPVLEALLAYGATRLDKTEMITYHNALVRQINEGGVNLKTAVEIAIAEAKGLNDVAIQEED